MVDKNSTEDVIEIIGDNGKICLPCFSHEGIKLVTEKGTEELKFNNPQHISEKLIEQVINELRGKVSCVSTGESAARTSWVLDEMVKNYYAD